MNTTDSSQSLLMRLALRQEQRRALGRGRTSRRVAVVAGATAIAMGGGVALAAWAASGTGDGHAEAGAAQALGTTAMNAAAITAGPLYPNGTATDAQITITNPNPYPVQITTVSSNGAITASGGTGTCTTHGVTFNNKTGLTINVPAKSGATNGSVTATLPGAVTMSLASETGCQNAVFTIPVTFSGASS